MRMQLGRRSVRVPVWLVINEVVSLDTGEVLARDAVSRNVSLDGMELEMRVAPHALSLVEPDRRLRVSVYLVDRFVMLKARVARTIAERRPERADGTGEIGSRLVRLGLQLQEMPVATRRLLARVLERSGATVMVVDDEEMALDTVSRQLSPEFRVLTARSAEEALRMLADHPVDVIVADHRMPGMSGLELLEEANRRHPNVVSILLSAHVDSALALRAIHSGHIYAYLNKPVGADEIVVAITHALDRQRIVAENRSLVQRLFQANDYLRAELDRHWRVDNIVGADGGLKDVLDQARRISNSNATVLITGESGTGKELIAHAIHQFSSRCNKALVRFNCAALSESLLESELFGHEKGAFTGATERRVGRFELADGGTLFLDEIGDVPLRMQVKLLRVLQEREFERVGGNQTIKVDIRVIAATNQNLSELVERGRFRADLYYRLNVINVQLAPLRERRQDVPALVEHFLQHFSAELHKPVAGITDEAMALLVAYDWPGNVRELKNEIERLVALCEPGVPIGPEMLTKLPMRRLNGTGDGDNGVSQPAGSQVGGSTFVDTAGTLHEAVERLEREMIGRALRECRGNQVHAARRLGLSREGLRKKLRRYGLAP